MNKRDIFGYVMTAFGMFCFLVVAFVTYCVATSF